MKLFRQVRFFDIGMLTLGTSPFWVMYGLSLFANSAWQGSIAMVLAYLIFVPTCLGFPMVAILYFVWRFNGSKST